MTASSGTSRSPFGPRTILLVAIAGLILFGVGVWVGSAGSTDKEQPARTEAKKPKWWTCSMHPQIKQPEPGKCPICGMDLIPLEAGGGDEAPRQMTMSPAAMKLAEIQTTTVRRQFVDVEIPLVGKISFDETRVRTISAWVPGRLDRLFVDYTGIPVKKGDHLVKIYSPELYASQEELLQAILAVEKVKNSQSEFVRRTAAFTVVASREKLRLLGLTAAQVAAIEKRGTATSTLEIKSPIGGIVIQKFASEGMYVKTGTPIYKVADLSRVWVNLDAYESDLAWIRYGQKVDLRTETHGDEIFPGVITFIHPVLNPKTRTVKVRVLAENPHGRLKPNMFVRAVIKARIGKGSEVVAAALKGKWICPMHPEVVEDKPGSCEVCGMALVKPPGLADGEEISGPPLVVPATAVLFTGRRSVVYIRVPNKKEPTFKGLEIEIGPRAGAYYVVRSGLKEGDEVVTHGAFKIDSALQIQAQPSMMGQREKAEAGKVPAGAEFLAQLAPLYAAYLKAQAALAGDREKEARAALAAAAAAVDKVDMALVKDAAHQQWMAIHKQIKAALEHREHAKDMTALRGLFSGLSAAVIRLEKTFGHAGSEAHVQVFCEMVNNNQGASWLQLGEEVRNPYYGAQMLGCGAVKEKFAGALPASGK